jgi:hypothetical protein
MNEYHNAAETISRLSGTQGKEWTVCRFVQVANNEPATFGWPLQWLEKDNTGGPLGWSKDGAVAFFDEKEAHEIAKTSNYKIATDKPVHISKIEWVVRVYSHYDGSSIITYTGNDYIQAEKELALGLLIQQRNANLYIKVELKGKTPA